MMRMMMLVVGALIVVVVCSQGCVTHALVEGAHAGLCLSFSFSLSFILCSPVCM